MAEWLLTTIVAAINIMLIFGLLYVYIKNLVKIKSGFTFGLTFFAVLFLFHNILVFYFSITMMPLYAESVSSFMLIFTLLQTVAFVALNWITWR